MWLVMSFSLPPPAFPPLMRQEDQAEKRGRA